MENVLTGSKESRRCKEKSQSDRLRQTYAVAEPIRSRKRRLADFDRLDDCAVVKTPVCRSLLATERRTHERPERKSQGQQKTEETGYLRACCLSLVRSISFNCYSFLRTPSNRGTRRLMAPFQCRSCTAHVATLSSFRDNRFA